jgi:hypothetical protein
MYNDIWSAQKAISVGKTPERPSISFHWHCQREQPSVRHRPASVVKWHECRPCHPHRSTPTSTVATHVTAGSLTISTIPRAVVRPVLNARWNAARNTLLWSGFCRSNMP